MTFQSLPAVMRTGQAATQAGVFEFAVASTGTQTIEHLPKRDLDLREKNSRLNLKALLNSLMLASRQPQMMALPAPPPVTMPPPPQLPPPSPAPAPPRAPLPNLERGQIAGLNRSQLHGYLRSMGESTHGNVDELKARVTRFFDALCIERYLTP